MQFNARPQSGGDGGSGKYVKLGPGENIVGIPRGEPCEFEKAFRPGEPEKFRFQINLVVTENGALVAKIFEGGMSVYGQLAQLSQAGWNLETTYIKISRTGKGKEDTRYTVTPSPSPVPKNILDQLSRVTLQELGRGTKPALQVVGGEPLEPGSDVDERF